MSSTNRMDGWMRSYSTARKWATIRRTLIATSGLVPGVQRARNSASEIGGKCSLNAARPPPISQTSASTTPRPSAPSATITSARIRSSFIGCPPDHSAAASDRSRAAASKAHDSPNIVFSKCSRATFPEGRVGWSARRFPALPGRVPAECRIARLGNPGHGLVGRLLGRVVVEQVALVLLSLADAGEGDLVAAHLPLDLARLVVVDPGHRAGDGVVHLLNLEGEFPAVSIHHPGPAEVLGPG